jgi:hypothetical protein
MDRLRGSNAGIDFLPAADPLKLINLNVSVRKFLLRKLPHLPQFLQRHTNEQTQA